MLSRRSSENFKEPNEPKALEFTESKTLEPQVLSQSSKSNDAHTISPNNSGLNASHTSTNLSQNSHDYHRYDVDVLGDDASSPSVSPEEESKRLETLQKRLVTLPNAAVTIFKDKRLGSGAFGSVYEGVYQGQRVAVKEFNPRYDLKLNKAEALQAFEWETSRLSSLNHSNLLRFYGVCRNEAGTLYMVMELCQSQNLAKRLSPLAPAVSALEAIDNDFPQDAYVPIVELAEESGASLDNQPDIQEENPKDASASHYSPVSESTEEGLAKAPRPRILALPEAPPIGWSLFWRIALDLAHGLSYLHAEGTLHRDLKSENVLFGLTGRAKLADLGVAQVDELVQTEEAKVVSRNLKDYGYAAPEEFKGQSSPKSDMFSYGLVLCEMLQGRTLGNLFKRKAGQLEIIPEKCLSPIRALIEQCWQPNPEARPSANDAIHQLEACYAECGVSLKDRLLPRLEQLLEPHQSALRQYIPSHITPNAQTSQPAQTIQEALQRFMEQDARVLAILGEGGLGKSLCAYQLAEQLLTLYRQEQGSWMPIFIRPGIPQWRHDALADGLRASLSHYDLSPSVIDSLREQRLLFIFDGYDELSGQAMGNLPTTLGLGDFPNAKLIISARPMPDLISALSQKLGFEGNCVAHTLQPFTAAQRFAFLQNTLLWDDEQQQWFSSQLANALDLDQALQNPFVLHLFAHSWESQRKHNLETLKKHEIYETFIRHWVETYASLLPVALQKQLFGNNALQSVKNWLTLAAFGMARASTLSLSVAEVESAWTYLPETLTSYASSVFQSRLDAITVKTKALFAANPEQKEGLTQELTALRRRALMSLPQYKALLLARAQQFLDHAPLKQRKGHYQFIHKSFWEYCMASGIHQALAHPLTQPNSVTRLGLQPSLILEDPSVHRFLEALAHPEDIAHWQRWIRASAQSLDVASAAACAMTALNAIKRPFPLNLSGIRIPGADLRGALLDSVNFENADLSQVRLAGAWLQNANFRGALLSKVSFGEYPFLLFQGKVHDCGYSPDGRLLAVAEDNVIHTYSIETELRLRTFVGHTDTVNSVVFSPNGQYLASGSFEGTVRLWDAIHGNELKILKGHASVVTRIAFHPNSQQLLSASRDKSLRLWDVANGSLLNILSGHTQWITSVAFSPNGAYLASASVDHSVRIWESKTGRLLNKLQHPASLESIAFSPDGLTLVSGSHDNVVRLWEVETGREINQLIGHTNPVSTVAFSPDGRRIASGSLDRSIRLWDVESGHELNALQGHTQEIIRVMFSPDGLQIASASRDRTVRLWETTKSHELKAPKRHTNEVMSVAFSPDGLKIASGSLDHSIRLWDRASGRELQTLLENAREIKSIAFSSDGFWLACTREGEDAVRVWEITSGRVIQVCQSHTGALEGVVFSPDGLHVASGSADGYVQVWERTTGRLVKTLEGHTAEIRCVAFSPNGDYLASGGLDNSVRLWDIASGKEIKKFQVGKEYSAGWIGSIAFSPNGLQLASGGFDHVVRVWDVVTGREQQVFAGHTLPVSSVAFSPDGRYLASGSQDQTLCLWELETGIRYPVNTLSGVNSLCWLQREKEWLLGTGHADSGVRCWRMRTSNTAPRLQLLWASAPTPLMAEGVRLKDVRGLSRINAMLLKQRGAVGEPLLLGTTDPAQPVLWLANAPKSPKQTSAAPKSPIQPSLKESQCRPS